MIHNKAAQGNHSVNDQLSIFTAVSYQGNLTQSFAVINDENFFFPKKTHNPSRYFEGR